MKNMKKLLASLLQQPLSTPFDTELRSKIYRLNMGVHLCVRPQGGHAGPPLQKLSSDRQMV